MKMNKILGWIMFVLLVGAISPLAIASGFPGADIPTNSNQNNLIDAIGKINQNYIELNSEYNQYSVQFNTLDANYLNAIETNNNALASNLRNNVIALNLSVEQLKIKVADLKADANVIKSKIQDSTNTPLQLGDSNQLKNKYDDLLVKISNLEANVNALNARVKEFLRATAPINPNYNFGDRPRAADRLPYGDVEIPNEIRDRLNISDILSNTAPVFTSNNYGTTARTGITYTYTATATDAENDALTFALESAPNWLTVTARTANSVTISGMPTNAGTAQVSISVTDEHGRKVSQTYTLTVVLNTNHIPQFTSTQVTTGVVGTNYVYTVTATDADNEALTFALESAPAWLSMVQLNGNALISGTPTAVGTYEISISVTDHFNDKVYQNYTLTISATGGSNGTGNNGTTTDPLATERAKYNEYKQDYEDYDDDYDSYKKKYRDAEKDNDENDMIKYEDKLDDLDENLNNLYDDIEDLIDDLEDDGTTSEERTLIADLEDLQDDIDNLRDNISNLIGSDTTISSSSSKPTTTTTKPTTTTTEKPSVVYQPTQTSVVAEQANSWEKVRLVAWLSAGIIIILAIILFLLAVLLKK